jgi:hypothetical protein
MFFELFKGIFDILVYITRQDKNYAQSCRQEEKENKIMYRTPFPRTTTKRILSYSFPMHRQENR